MYGVVNEGENAMTQASLKTFTLESGEALHRIEPIEITYINERGIRRVGQAHYCSQDGEIFLTRHKAGYSVAVTTDQIAV